mgnify:CR=1 FL=1
MFKIQFLHMIIVKFNLWGNNWIIMGDLNDIIKNGEGTKDLKAVSKISKIFINQNKLMDLT